MRYPALLVVLVLVCGPSRDVNADSPGTRLSPSSLTHKLAGTATTVDFKIDVSDYRDTNQVWVIIQVKNGKPFSEIGAQLTIHGEKTTHLWTQLLPIKHPTYEGNHFNFLMSDDLIKQATVYLALPVNEKIVPTEMGGYYFHVADFAKSSKPTVKPDQ
jgi:hypothetical protein